MYLIYDEHDKLIEKHEHFLFAKKMADQMNTENIQDYYIVEEKVVYSTKSLGEALRIGERKGLL